MVPRVFGGRMATFWEVLSARLRADLTPLWRPPTQNKVRTEGSDNAGNGHYLEVMVLFSVGSLPRAGPLGLRLWFAPGAVKRCG